ncbi:unnamed protein product (macronuclear) [Paramecium tetraurelia]|uniref:EF-hand domain-containing protein n=1 Tax=Paramecium tetraurelia TaxID=5888 RepID=A0DZ92_PARTE|nr:uncharacterized protein GSPATT00003328001 [Paramecium tetraurelia]CAK88359.1 unnamed protein product [Paramecium tetraurelia]|eukprot:XP_001455756.1 hypothetical protein (macronuclear) [Paramecium tetraurelia strain d4-2]
MEGFIKDLLFEEFRELSFLFSSFVKEMQFNLSEQQSQLTMTQKQQEKIYLENIQTQKQQFLEKITNLELIINSRDKKINEIKENNLKIEKDISELISRNSALIQKVEQRNKIINRYDKMIKQQDSEISILRQKIQCYENKLHQSYETIQQLTLLQNNKSSNNQLNRQSTGQLNRQSTLQLNRQQTIQLIRQQTIQTHSPIILDGDDQNDSPLTDTLNEIQQQEEEQLNQLEINFERIIKQAQKEQQVEVDLLPFYSKEIEIQTELTLIDSQFDIISQTNINNAVRYTEFIEKVGRKGSEESLIDQIIDETYDQLDVAQNHKKNIEMNKSQFSMIKSGYSQNGQNAQQQNTQQQIPTLTRCDSNIINNQPPIKKESKSKQVLSFISFLKSRMQQQEQEIQYYNEQITQFELNAQNANTQMDELQKENERLQIQLAQLNSKIQQSQQSHSQSDLKQQDDDVHQSQDSLVINSQKRVSVLIKQGTFKETKKQRKAPQLGQKVVISYDFQKDQSKKIIEKLKNKQMQKFNNYMPVKLVLKYITTLYNEKLQSQKEYKQIKDQDMGSYIYNYYLQQFGFTKVTEQKYQVLLLSVKKNIKVIRINMFARFMGLLELNVNYTVEEQQKYLEAWDFMNTQQNLGQSLKDNESEMKMYVPFVRALSYIGQLIFSPQNDELVQLKHEVELLKENDPKNINKQGIIDFDLMMIKVLQVFRNTVEKTKLYVINAFAASDLDGNGMCNLDEFLILNKYIEADKYDEDKWIEVFEDNADIVTEEERALSFERFSILCMEYNLFSDQAQNKFLQIKHNHDSQMKFEQLRDSWPKDFINFNQKLQNAQIDEHYKEQWSKILEVLNQKILENPEQKKPLLIAYKIFLNESKVNKAQ